MTGLFVLCVAAEPPAQSAAGAADPLARDRANSDVGLCVARSGSSLRKSVEIPATTAAATPTHIELARAMEKAPWKPFRNAAWAAGGTWERNEPSGSPPTWVSCWPTLKPRLACGCR